MAPQRAVLLVDDEPDLCAVFSAVFAELGIPLLATINRAEVVQLAESQPIAAILFDPRLPDWGGIEEVRSLKRLFGYSTPVLILTGLLFDDEVEAAKTAGADDYIVMPFDVDYVIERILMHCGHEWRRRPLP